jgi:glycosyltransferase involved in cell wall biosynthesis
MRRKGSSHSLIKSCSERKCELAVAKAQDNKSCSSPLVSVVMSTFREIVDGRLADGTDSTLARAINSVTQQTYTQWELFVVSDHPPQADSEKIKALAETYTDCRIQFLDLEQRSGFARIGIEPKCFGISRSKGKVLAFLDGDNEWTTRHLEYCVKALEQDRHLDLVYCDSIVRLAERAAGYEFNELLRLVAFPYRLLGPLSGEEFLWSKPDWGARSKSRLEKYNFIDMSEVVMRMDSFKQAGGFKDHVTCDWGLWLEMIHQGKGRFKHLNHPGLLLKTASLKQHRQLFLLSQIHRYDIPFDMQEHENRITAERRADYLRKHEFQD